MFQDGSACRLGVPERQLLPKNNDATIPTDKEYASPYISKIGGHAVWHDRAAAPSEATDIICGQCKSSEHMVLVAQIYAPLEYDRSLYVFCCNKRVCSFTPQGWMVFRNQKLCAGTAAAVNANSIQTKKTAPTVSVWDCLNDAEDEGEDDFDFESLLQARDKGLADTINCKVTHKQQSANITDPEAMSSTGVVDTSRMCLPCWKISEVEDEATKYHSATCKQRANPITGQVGNEVDGNDDDNEDDDDDDDEMHDGVEIDDAYVNSLIANYMKHEDEVDILQCLTENLKFVPSAASIAASTTGAATVSKSGGNKATISSSDKSDDVETAGYEKKLSRGTAKDKTERNFLNCVSRCPQQVLRYAYEGVPLWISHPAPIVICDESNSGRKSGSSTRSSGTEAPISSVSDIRKRGKQWSQGQQEQQHKRRDGVEPPATTEAATAGRGGGGPTSPSAVHVPACENCGAQRVFEFQLMPALLSFSSTSAVTPVVLNTNTANCPAVPVEAAGAMGTSKGTSGVKGSNSGSSKGNPDGGGSTEVHASTRPNADQLADFINLLGSGLDFGVVTVWVCPRSCSTAVAGSVGKKYQTEVAIVQLPHDIQ